ncbi:hypothetical protein BEWA_010200 [Theileria equi strain WA]|uniref:Uncharacterized protein n=1 Tax=Theileria equi strain WA TaxID=1537102 RepID=L0B304_THEEQ|nr:hypothetical protein BEWA_010200 [Theileria equi strain WA]AFZ81606.1 hypothetical protein BEWA_010200 [Theileria equi strain WA]|eukprot:XP_004831272.1 hypothetical protein BEWA_010200 [Theileria equi strain WA]
MTSENVPKDHDVAEPSGEVVTNSSSDASYLANIIEHIMYEIGVESFDNRTSHMLVDILQRESLSLLKSSAEQSEKRRSTETEKLLCGAKPTNIQKTNMNVSEEDAQLACQEYMSKHVIQHASLNDIIEMQKYASNTKFGAKNSSSSGSKLSKNVQVSHKSDSNNMGFFPTGSPPYLPESISLNTLLPHWDITLKDK